MPFQVYKKIFVFVIIGVCIVAAGALFAASRLNHSLSRALVDYVPKEAEFWLWGSETVFKTNAAGFFKIFSIDEPIISELSRRGNHEFVIYSKGGLWYEIEAAKKSQDVLHRSDNLFLDQQYRERKNKLIGFIGESYAKEKLSAILAFVPQSSYYFTVSGESGDNGVDFLLVPSKQVGNTHTFAFDSLPAPDKSLVFALITDDQNLHKEASALIQEKIREYAAFEHPVAVSRTLPDGSVFNEKTADPKLFMWREDIAGIHSLVVDEKERLRLASPKEIVEISFPLQYYESNDRFFLGSNAQIMEASAREFGTAKNFMYFSFIANNDISFVDIMGKSDALNWLRKLGIQSIMVREEEGGVLMGSAGYEMSDR